MIAVRIQVLATLLAVLPFISASERKPFLTKPVKPKQPAVIGLSRQSRADFAPQQPSASQLDLLESCLSAASDWFLEESSTADSGKFAEVFDTYEAKEHACHEKYPNASKHLKAEEQKSLEQQQAEKKELGDFEGRLLKWQPGADPLPSTTTAVHSQKTSSTGKQVAGPHDSQHQEFNDDMDQLIARLQVTASDKVAAPAKDGVVASGKRSLPPKASESESRPMPSRPPPPIPKKAVVSAAVSSLVPEVSNQPSTRQSDGSTLVEPVSTASRVASSAKSPAPRSNNPSLTPKTEKATVSRPSDAQQHRTNAAPAIPSIVVSDENGKVVRRMGPK